MIALTSAIDLVDEQQVDVIMGPPTLQGSPMHLFAFSMKVFVQVHVNYMYSFLPFPNIAKISHVLKLYHLLNYSAAEIIGDLAKTRNRPWWIWVW